VKPIPRQSFRPDYSIQFVTRCIDTRVYDLDSEGGAKAGADKNKYFAPLALGILAAASMGGDEESKLLKNGAVSSVVRSAGPNCDDGLV